MIEMELKATHIMPVVVWPTRLHGKETGWIEYCVCRNCEDVTSHDLLTTETGFFYRCRKCNFESEVIER